MRITNKYNLPEPLYKALCKLSYISDNYDVISVSDLINPPRIWYLKKQFRDQLEEDASDRLWALFGTAIHYMISQEDADGLQEERLELEVEGMKIVGRFDLFTNTGILVDYKTTKTENLKYEHQEWEKQLNVYAFMLRKIGFDVRGLEIWTILRNHDVKFLNKEGYPPVAFVKKDIPLWTFEEQEQFILERIRLFKQVKEGADYLCSDEERWLNNGFYRRCKDYCPVRKFCEFNPYKEEVKENA